MEIKINTVFIIFCTYLINTILYFMYMEKPINPFQCAFVHHTMISQQP